MNDQDFGHPVPQMDTGSDQSEEFELSSENNWQISKDVLDSASQIERMKKAAEEHFGKLLMS